MVTVDYDEVFKKTFMKIKDKAKKEQVIKQISKIKDNPEIGKPMGYGRKNTRELYVNSYRISYNYCREEDLIYLLEIYHKDEQ